MNGSALFICLMALWQTAATVDNYNSTPTRIIRLIILCKFTLIFHQFSCEYATCFNTYYYQGYREVTLGHVLLKGHLVLYYMISNPL